MITLITWMLFHFFPARQRFHLQMKETRGMLIVGILLIRQKEREQDPLSLITLKNLFAVYLYFLWLLLEGAFEMKMQMIANALTKLPSSIGPSIRHLVLTPFGTWQCQSIDWFWHCLFSKRNLEMNSRYIEASVMLPILRQKFPSKWTI